MQVGREDAGVFVDTAVLHDDLVALADFYHVQEALVQEVNLDIERPALHIVVEVGKIGVVIDRFEFRGPFEVLHEHLGQRGFSTADIAGYRDVHNG